MPENIIKAKRDMETLREKMKLGNERTRNPRKRAVLFIGGTGAGKSTTSLLCAGYSL